LVFTTVTVWLQVLVSPQASAISQVSVIRFEQVPLVTRLAWVMSTLVGVVVPVKKVVQQDEATGGSNAQLLPHGTVLLVGHCTCKQLVEQLVPSSTVTVKLQLLLSPQ
jgi:hypothetical protein